jgi:hypothetical protein
MTEFSRGHCRATRHRRGCPPPHHRRPWPCHNRSFDQSRICRTPSHTLYPTRVTRGLAGNEEARDVLGPFGGVEDTCRSTLGNHECLICQRAAGSNSNTSWIAKTQWVASVQVPRSTSMGNIGSLGSAAGSRASGSPRASHSAAKSVAIDDPFLSTMPDRQVLTHSKTSVTTPEPDRVQAIQAVKTLEQDLSDLSYRQDRRGQRFSSQPGEVCRQFSAVAFPPCSACAFHHEFAKECRSSFGLAGRVWRVRNTLVCFATAPRRTEIPTVYQLP